MAGKQEKVADSAGFIAQKVRVHLNNKQSAWMTHHCHVARVAYNYAIKVLRSPLMGYEACIEASNDPTRFSSRIDGALQPASIDFKGVKFPSAFSVTKQWNHDRDLLYPWIKGLNLSMDTISNVITNNYGAAINQWKLSGFSSSRKPVFHKRGHGLSISFRGRLIKQVNSKTFMLPMKQGTFRIGCSMRFDGEIRSITFSKSGDKWYASFLTQSVLQKPNPAPDGTSIGVDVGVVKFASLSNGEQFEPAQDYDKELKVLAKLQRQQSRMVGPSRHQKASENWKKHNRKIQNLHRLIANKRKYYTEVVTKNIASRFQVVAIEDLKIKNMSASAKGTQDNPGKNVKQKAGLNRSILNGGFYNFRSKLEYKVSARSGTVIPVNPAYTSQTCHACGHVSKDNRKDQSTFLCVECGYSDNADVNAARNILIKALASNNNYVAVRDDNEPNQQGTSTPESLLTDPVTGLEQEVYTQDALIHTASAGSRMQDTALTGKSTRRRKRVGSTVQLDLFNESMR